MNSVKTGLKKTQNFGSAGVYFGCCCFWGVRGFQNGKNDYARASWLTK
jgi:hypothetical protein